MSKLREKFIPYTLENKLDISRSGEHNAKYCEQIVDDFAVKFVLWVMTDDYDIEVQKLDESKPKDILTTELLQIFKEKYYE